MLDTEKRVLIVAEIGNNHEGDVGVARELVERAADAGADAVKFQTFRTDAFVSPADADRYARMQRFELMFEEFAGLAELAHARGLLFVSTALDLESADGLAPIVDAYKVASGDIDFFPLLARVAAVGKPVVLSTGTAEPEEIVRAVETLAGAEVAVLHCVSSYPAPDEEINLRAIGALAELLPGRTIGFSDHTVGLDAAPLAVACGARIVEKHFTLDKGFSEFRDHALSADSGDMRELVRRVRAAEALLGAPQKSVQPSERDARVSVRRSVAAARDLPAGHELEEGDIVWTRPADGIRPGDEALVLGRALRRPLAQGEHVREEDVS